MSTDSVWSKLICLNKAASVGGEKDDGEWMEPVRPRRAKSSRGGGRAARTGGSSRRDGAARGDVVAGKEPKKPARRRSTADLEDDESDDDDGGRREEGVDAAVTSDGRDVSRDGRDASREGLPFGERLAMMLIRSVFSEEAVLRTAREIRGGSDSVAGGSDDDDDDDNGHVGDDSGGVEGGEGGESADIIISFVKPGNAGEVDDARHEEPPWPWSDGADDAAREATGSSNAINSEWSNIINSDSEDEPDEATRISEAARSNPGEGGTRSLSEAGEGGMRRVTSSNGIDRMSKLDRIPEFSDAAWDKIGEEGTARKTTNSKLVKPNKINAKKGGWDRRATESNIVSGTGEGGMQRATGANAIDRKGELDGIPEFSGAARDEAREGRTAQNKPSSKLIKPKNNRAKKGGWARRATESQIVSAAEGRMRKATSSITIGRKTELDGISELSGDAWDEAREGKATRETTSSKLVKPRKKNAVNRKNKLNGIPEFSDAAFDKTGEGGTAQKTTSSKLVKPKHGSVEKGGWARRATESQVIDSKERPKLLSQFSDAAWC